DNGEYHTVLESNDGGDTWQDIGPLISFMDDNNNYFGDGMILTQDNLSVSLDGRYLYLSTTKNGIYRCELPPMAISEDNPATKPNSIDLNIWPNPFNSTVNLTFHLQSKTENLTINIYNITGSLVWGMEKGDIEAGYYSETWNGTDENGVSQPSGVYLIRMEAGDNSVTQKAILLK
ncbi:MAG: FlgD immunoglobulin-like domain containing protein, partial [bacterium]